VYLNSAVVMKWTRLLWLNGFIDLELIVALARKLLIALWRFLKTGVLPEGAVLKGETPSP
jgi:hypothetical protein